MNQFTTNEHIGADENVDEEKHYHHRTQHGLADNESVLDRVSSSGKGEFTWTQEEEKRLVLKVSGLRTLYQDLCGPNKSTLTQSTLGMLLVKQDSVVNSMPLGLGLEELTAVASAD